MSHVLLTTLILAFVTQSVNAAPAVDQPTYEPGVLYLPDKAIALGIPYKKKSRLIMALIDLAA